MSEPTGKLGEIFDRLNAGAGGSHLHQILNSLIWYLAERETIPVPALERGGETNINLNPNAKYFCPNCGLSQFETSRERHNKECPGRSAPTPATVETAPTMSEKAATPEIILWAHRLRKECLGRKPIDLLDITAKRAVELANQFDAMQCKIDALQAENKRLRGQVEDLLDCKFQPIDWPRARRIYAQFKERYPDSASKETI